MVTGRRISEKSCFGSDLFAGDLEGGRHVGTARYADQADAGKACGHAGTDHQEPGADRCIALTDAIPGRRTGTAKSEEHGASCDGEDREFLYLSGRYQYDVGCSDPRYDPWCIANAVRTGRTDGNRQRDRSNGGRKYRFHAGNDLRICGDSVRWRGE